MCPIRPAQHCYIFSKRNHASQLGSHPIFPLEQLQLRFFCLISLHPIDISFVVDSGCIDTKYLSPNVLQHRPHVDSQIPPKPAATSFESVWNYSAGQLSSPGGLESYFRLARPLHAFWFDLRLRSLESITERVMPRRWLVHSGVLLRDITTFSCPVVY